MRSKRQLRVQELTLEHVRQRQAELDAADERRHELALLALDAGASLRQVAAVVGVSHETVRKWWQRRELERERGEPGA